MILSTLISNKKIAGRTFLIYLLSSVFCCIFGLIYEHFSHGVFSPYMAFMFLIPLLPGAVPYGILFFFPGKIKAKSICRCVYNSGIAALTVGSCVKGILDIYGTTSSYTIVYLIAGIILLITGIVIFILDKN